MPHLRSRVCASSRALFILAVVVCPGAFASAQAGGEVSDYYRLGLDYELGREVDKDLFEAARQYQVAAEQGHVEAQFSLALLLAGAVPDSPRNPRKSFEWFSEAAQQGHTRAAYFLALSYQTGTGVEANSELAFEWYRRSAKDGSGEAMNALARMYAAGAGIRLNLANAYAWNEVAGDRGYVLAPQYRAELEAKMNEEELVRGKKLVRSLMKKYGRPPG